MPTRTKKEALAMKAMDKKLPDKLCNARIVREQKDGTVKSHYCKNPAGYKTDHIGSGRCKYHGGNAGRKIVHGLYSKKLTSTLKQEFEKISSDPKLIDLTNELAVTKTLLSNFLQNINDIANEIQWTGTNRFGETVEHPKVGILLKILEQMRRIYQSISDVEMKSKNVLTIRQVYSIVQQITGKVNTICQSCPVRVNLSRELSQGIKVESDSEDDD